jgi:hypothetical protein
MSSHRFHRSIFGFALLTAVLPLSAQGWHLEVQDQGRVYLVNDSSKTIEAFYGFGFCRDGGLPASFGAGLNDVLGLYNDNDMQGQGFLPGIGVEPGGRWNTIFSQNGQCEGKVDAVVFSDGTYAGNPFSVRAIQARREGIRASVNYWSEEFSKQNPDASDFAALTADAKHRVAEDWRMAHQVTSIALNRSVPDTLPMAYWYTRVVVDQQVEVWCSYPTDGKATAEYYQQLASKFAQWKKMIDTNVAMQKLRAEFPPVTEDSAKPEPLAAQH